VTRDADHAFAPFASLRASIREGQRAGNLVSDLD
jgi:hypothetical protein